MDPRLVTSSDFYHSSARVVVGYIVTSLMFLWHGVYVIPMCLNFLYCEGDQSGFYPIIGFLRVLP